MRDLEGIRYSKWIGNWIQMHGNAIDSHSCLYRRELVMQLNISITISHNVSSPHRALITPVMIVISANRIAAPATLNCSPLTICLGIECCREHVFSPDLPFNKRSHFCCGRVERWMCLQVLWLLEEAMLLHVLSLLRCEVT